MPEAVRPTSLDPKIAARLKRDASGLFAAIAQQYDTGEVLMLGWMDDEALHRTLTTGRCTYWSRSREEYWVKGESSGHQQWVKSVALDCDADAVLVQVDQVGGACHTGDRTCFDADVLDSVTGERPDASAPGCSRAAQGVLACPAGRRSRRGADPAGRPAALGTGRVHPAQAAVGAGHRCQRGGPRAGRRGAGPGGPGVPGGGDRHARRAAAGRRGTARGPRRRRGSARSPLGCPPPTCSAWPPARSGLPVPPVSVRRVDDERVGRGHRRRLDDRRNRARHHERHALAGGGAGGALLIVVAGLATAWRGPSWPIMSARYDAPGRAPGTAARTSTAVGAAEPGPRRGGAGAGLGLHVGVPQTPGPDPPTFPSGMPAHARPSWSLTTNPRWARCPAGTWPARACLSGSSPRPARRLARWPPGCGPVRH